MLVFIYTAHCHLCKKRLRILSWYPLSPTEKKMNILQAALKLINGSFGDCLIYKLMYGYLFHFSFCTGEKATPDVNGDFIENNEVDANHKWNHEEL